MDPELADALQRYLDGGLSRRQLEELLASFDIWNGWQDGNTDIEVLRAAVGPLQLALADVGSGIRTERELLGEVERLLAETPESAVPRTS